jgi:2,5-diketo-D-gluconate reductase A
MSYDTIGLGTYRLRNTECEKIVSSAINMGYRLIDTAELYRNHQQIAHGIKLSDVSRDNIFIISKIHPTTPADKIPEHISNILRELDTDYLDLLLLHRPNQDYVKCWEQMIRSHAQMNIRKIGVSNFNATHLDQIEKTGVIPFLNQIECSVFLQRKDLIKRCDRSGILVQAYSSLISNPNDSAIWDIAQKLNISSQSLMLNFLREQNIGVIPKSTNLIHLKENLQSIKLDSLSMNLLQSIDCNYSVYPKNL